MPSETRRIRSQTFSLNSLSIDSIDMASSSLEERLLSPRRNFKGTVLQHALDSPAQVREPIRRFSKMVFLVTRGLVTLGSCVNMKVVESVALDPIRMLMASTIIAPQTK